MDRQRFIRGICFHALFAAGSYYCIHNEIQSNPYYVDHNPTVAVQLLYLFSFFYHAHSYHQSANRSLATRIHHAITPSVIWLSRFHGFTPVGVHVMFLHDFADVFMYITRFLRGRKALQSLSLIFLLPVWLLTRIYWFGKLAIWNVPLTFVLHNVVSFSCFVILLILWILNVYWFVLVLAKASEELYFSRLLKKMQGVFSKILGHCPSFVLDRMCDRQ
jgi:hypothetical protein